MAKCQPYANSRMAGSGPRQFTPLRYKPKRPNSEFEEADRQHFCESSFLLFHGWLWNWKSGENKMPPPRQHDHRPFSTLRWPRCCSYTVFTIESDKIVELRISKKRSKIFLFKNAQLYDLVVFYCKNYIRTATGPS